MLTTLAPAKVNLTLHVGRAKPDGRHDLDSLVVFAAAEAADRLVVEPAETLSLAVIGPMAEACGPVGDNLVMKAAYALKTAMNVSTGARITLAKHLPAAAGIGGGSADAGAALRLLNTLWDGPSETDAHLRALAAKLGGDVPVAVRPRTSLMRGEGERIQPFNLPDLIPAVLVNSGIDCPTGPVFRRFDDMGGGEEFTEVEPPAMASLEDVFAWLETTYNDLEGPAMSRVPEIAHILGELRTLSGQRLVRMSGSGATCFALFETQAAADAAAVQLQAAHTDWWVRATAFGGGAV